jgi:hypothetical protein
MNHDGERDGSARALETDALMPEDCEYIRCVMELLEPFKTWTNRLQKKNCNGYVADILPATDELLWDLERAKVFYQRAGQSTHLITSIKNAWDVLKRFADSPPHVSSPASLARCFSSRLRLSPATSLLPSFSAPPLVFRVFCPFPSLLHTTSYSPLRLPGS